MVQLHAFRRSLHLALLGAVALMCCLSALVASASPASARSHGGVRYHHGVRHFARVRHGGHRAGRHFAYRHYRYRHVARRDDSMVSRWDNGVAQMQARGFADANASIAPGTFSGAAATYDGFGSSNVVAVARRYIGGNPTGRGNLWCARFMNLVLQRSGHAGTGSDLASSFAHYGQRVSGPEIGAIAVMSRHGGGHVGVVSGFDAKGDPILVSGNNRNRVVEAPVSSRRVYAYVMPN